MFDEPQRGDIIELNSHHYEVLDVYWSAQIVHDQRTEEPQDEKTPEESIRHYLDVQLHWMRSTQIHPTHALHYYPDTKQIIFYDFAMGVRIEVDPNMITKKKESR